MARKNRRSLDLIMGKKWKIESQSELEAGSLEVPLARRDTGPPAVLGAAAPVASSRSVDEDPGHRGIDGHDVPTIGSGGSPPCW